MMKSPQEFAKITGLSYQQVLTMCKAGEIETIKTQRGHFKIHEHEVDKFLNKKDFVSREDYEKIIRENEKLKTLLNQFKIMINTINTGDKENNNYNARNNVSRAI